MKKLTTHCVIHSPTTTIRPWEIYVNITTLPANISPKTSRSSKSPAELEIFPPASPVLAFPMVDDDDSHKSIFFYLLIGQSSITQRCHKDNQKQKLSRHLPSLMSHHHHSCPASLSSVAVCLKLRFLAGWNRFCLLF